MHPLISYTHVYPLARTCMHTHIRTHTHIDLSIHAYTCIQEVAKETGNSENLHIILGDVSLRKDVVRIIEELGAKYTTHTHTHTHTLSLSLSLSLPSAPPHSQEIDRTERDRETETKTETARQRQRCFVAE